MTDITYSDKGLFTSFIPASTQGEDVWRQLNAAGADTVLTIHAKSIINQMRAAGYSVVKAKKATKSELNDIFAELDELMGE